MVDGDYRRRSARVFLVDGAGRLLLFHFLNDDLQPERGSYWITPGGGVTDGESLAVAAARELREETGLVVDPKALGSTVAETTGHADFGWAAGVFRDDFFFHRVDRHEVDTSRLEALERRHLIGHRWWTIEQLGSTSETVYPLGLVQLLTHLLAGPIPSQPARLPWHH